MADHPAQRPYRTEDERRPSWRDADERAWTPSNNDPLAELARLIGQEDPFAPARQEAQSRTHAQPRRPAEPAAPDWLTRPSEPSAESYGHGSDDARAASHATPHLAPRSDVSSPEPDWQDHRSGDQPYDGRYGDPRFAPAHAAAVQGYANEDPHAYYDDRAHYDERAHEQSYPYDEDEAYEPQPVQRRRRGGLTTVLVVVGIAALGTAGAFGYRAFFGPNKADNKPPVIMADTGPNKVVPAASPSSDSSQSKLVYDRLPDRSSAERVVSREEQPVERPAAARVVLPGAPSAFTNAAAPAASSQPGLAGNEPKRVRTVTIRPDGGVVGAVPSAPPVRATAAPSTSTAPAAPAAPGPSRLASRGSAPSSGPLAIAPQSPAESAPARNATPSREPSVPDGSYMVQLTSQKSETDAQASYRALQSKYPNVLGDRQPVIRRADLGSKGIYYRAQIGPFTTADQANEFCGNLKSAGGQCIVQRN